MKPHPPTRYAFAFTLDGPQQIAKVGHSTAYDALKLKGGRFSHLLIKDPATGLLSLKLPEDAEPRIAIRRVPYVPNMTEFKKITSDAGIHAAEKRRMELLHSGDRALKMMSQRAARSARKSWRHVPNWPHFARG